MRMASSCGTPRKAATCTASSSFIWRSLFNMRDTADGASIGDVAAIVVEATGDTGAPVAHRHDGGVGGNQLAPREGAHFEAVLAVVQAQRIPIDRLRAARVGRIQRLAIEEQVIDLKVAGVP